MSPRSGRQRIVVRAVARSAGLNNFYDAYLGFRFATPPGFLLTRVISGAPSCGLLPNKKTDAVANRRAPLNSDVRQRSADDSHRTGCGDPSSKIA